MNPLDNGCNIVYIECNEITRIYDKMPIYFHTDGRPSPYPTSREQSKRERKVRYDSGIKCSKCNDCEIRHTFNDKCIHCARLEALEYYNEFVVNSGVNPALNVQEAISRGVDFWISTEACSKAGHVGSRTIDNQCCGCVIDARSRAKVKALDPLSPRQQALHDGKKWYPPKDPCPRCGTTALRYVDNGRCRGCVPLKRAEEGETLTADTYMTTYLPDLVISKAAAIDKGLTIYRTGAPCDNGHKVYRDVESERCLGC